MDTGVKFNNNNYHFADFHQHYKKNCEQMSKNKVNELNNTFQIFYSFIINYIRYIGDSNVEKEYLERANSIRKELIEKNKFLKIQILKNNSGSAENNIKYIETFFNYYLDMFSLIGDFSIMLKKTFMPNTKETTKYFSFNNNNPFTENFVYYKTFVIDSMSSFKPTYLNSINLTKVMLGFYFAYYPFVEEVSKKQIDETFSYVIQMCLNKDFISFHLNNQIKNEIMYSNIIHSALSNIFLKLSDNYISYNIMPKIQKRVILDKSTI